MNQQEAKRLKKGDRVFWSNPNPGADPESGGVVKDVNQTDRGWAMMARPVS